jgi:hypothetical protein
LDINLAIFQSIFPFLSIKDTIDDEVIAMNGIDEIPLESYTVLAAVGTVIAVSVGVLLCFKKSKSEISEKPDIAHPTKQAKSDSRKQTKTVENKVIAEILSCCLTRARKPRNRPQMQPILSELQY